MRIATVIPDLYAAGGAEQMCERLMNELGARGHEIHVYTRTEQERDIDDRNFEVHNLFVRPWMMSDAFWKVPKALRKLEPDVVHCFHAYPTPLWTYSVARKADLQVIVSAMGDDIQLEEEHNYGIRQNRLKDFLIKRSLRTADALTVWGEYMVDTGVDVGMSREDVVPLMNAVPEPPETDEDYLDTIREKHGIDPDKKTVLYLGRFSEKKRVEDLVKASADLDPDEYQVILVGKGDTEPRLRDIIEEHNLDHVSLPGAIFGKEKFALFRLCDLFVLPSFLEGMPTVLVEAAKAGAPFLASDIEGNMCVVENYNHGFSYPMGDIDALAQQIQELCRTEMEGGPVLDDRFTIESVADTVENLYQE